MYLKSSKTKNSFKINKSIPITFRPNSVISKNYKKICESLSTRYYIAMFHFFYFCKLKARYREITTQLNLKILFYLLPPHPSPHRLNTCVCTLSQYWRNTVHTRHAGVTQTQQQNVLFSCVRVCVTFSYTCLLSRLSPAYVFVSGVNRPPSVTAFKVPITLLLIV